MKKLKALIVILAMIGLPLLSIADDPTPPPPPGSGGPGGGQNPVGAPIDAGLGILLALGLGYGGYKLYRMKHEEKVEEPSE